MTVCVREIFLTDGRGNLRLFFFCFFRFCVFPSAVKEPGQADNHSEQDTPEGRYGAEDQRGTEHHANRVAERKTGTYQGLKEQGHVVKIVNYEQTEKDPARAAETLVSE